MRICGSDGQSLELRVLRYQFPETSDDEYDANWLMIEGVVSHPRGGWSFCDPCLLTYEGARLADWLDAVGQNESCATEMGFLEPNLSFALIRRPGGGKGMLRVYFELESRPHWARAPTAGRSDLWVEFPVLEAELRRAARELREQLARYPERGKR
jgi:hypothetical protein